MVSSNEVSPTSSHTGVLFGRILMVVVGIVLVCCGFAIGYLVAKTITFAALALLIAGTSMIVLGLVLPRKIIIQLKVLLHIL
jgi:hypothetical protein